MSIVTYTPDYKQKATHEQSGAVALKGPQLLHLRVNIDLTSRTWEAFTGPASAQKFLHYLSGYLPRNIARLGGVRANTFALNIASRQALRRFKGAKIVCIEVNPENVNAPVVRLQIGGGEQRCAA